MPHDLWLSSWIKQHQFKELLGNYTNPGQTRTRITCQCLFLNYTQCICTSISQTLFQIQVKFHPTLVTGKLPSYYLDLPSSHTSYQSWTVMANMLHQIRRIKTAIPFQIADKTKRRQNHASLQDSRSVTVCFVGLMPWMAVENSGSKLANGWYDAILNCWTTWEPSQSLLNVFDYSQVSS